MPWAKGVVSLRRPGERRSAQQIQEMFYQPRRLLGRLILALEVTDLYTSVG